MSAGADSTPRMDSHDQNSRASGAADAETRLRRLSTGSDSSDFSVISTPSVRSLDSNGSLKGGVSVGGSQSHIRQQDNQTNPIPTLSNLNLDGTVVRGTTSGDHRTQLAESDVKASPFWYKYPGFTPEPKAKFRDEFARLQKYIGLNNENRRDLFVEALDAEIAFHYGTCLHRLDRWQDLCEELGIEEVPTSITKCKKVSRCLCEV